MPPCCTGSSSLCWLDFLAIAINPPLFLCCLWRSCRFNGFSSSTGSLADLTDGASVVDIRQPLFNGEDGGATIVGRQALTVPHSQSMVDERVLMRCNEGYDRPGVQDQPVALGREGQGASTQMNGASEIVVAMPHQATR